MMQAAMRTRHSSQILREAITLTKPTQPANQREKSHWFLNYALQTAYHSLLIVLLRATAVTPVHHDGGEGRVHRTRNASDSLCRVLCLWCQVRNPEHPEGHPGKNRNSWHQKLKR